MAFHESTKPSGGGKNGKMLPNPFCLSTVRPCNHIPIKIKKKSSLPRKDEGEQNIRNVVTFEKRPCISN